jgi:hypothetical protein
MFLKKFVHCFLFRKYKFITEFIVKKYNIKYISVAAQFPDSESFMRYISALKIARSLKYLPLATIILNYFMLKYGSLNVVISWIICLNIILCNKFVLRDIILNSQWQWI